MFKYRIDALVARAAKLLLKLDSIQCLTDVVVKGT